MDVVCLSLVSTKDFDQVQRRARVPRSSSMRQLRALWPPWIARAPLGVRRVSWWGASVLVSFLVSLSLLGARLAIKGRYMPIRSVEEAGPFELLILGAFGTTIALLFCWSWFSERRELVAMKRWRVRAAEHAARAGLDDDTRAVLAGQLRRRRQFWTHRFVHDFNARSNQRLYSLDPVSRLLLVFMLVTYVCLTFDLVITAGASMSLFYVLLLMYFALGSMSMLRMRRLRRRCLRAIKESRCPDCDYDLSTVEPALEPSELGSVVIGPARCVECGAPWPLVPAPIPSDARKMEQPWLKERRR